MQVKDRAVLVISESPERRLIRMIAFIAIAVLVSFLVLYQFAVSTFVVIACLLISAFWGRFFPMRRLVVRPYDFFATIGPGQSPIEWPDISNIEVRGNSIQISIDGGSMISISTQPYQAFDVVNFIRHVEMMKQLHHTDGKLRVPFVDEIRIETEDFLLRPLALEDRDKMIAIKTDPTEAATQLYDPVPEELNKDYYNMEQSQQQGGVMYWNLGVFAPDSDDLIGYICISLNSVLQRSCDLGLGIHKDHRGKGLGTKVVTATLQYIESHTNLIRVNAGCFEKNIACAKALQNSGMTQTHKIEKFWLRKGEWMTGLQFEKVFDRLAPTDVE